jgi:hypothetical protein
METVRLSPNYENMKYLFVFLIIICNSCSNDSKIKNELENDGQVSEHVQPSEPCELVSWSTSSVNTQGYNDKNYDIVIVETYKKNSRFDSLIKRYEIKNDGEIYDSTRMQKSFNLPKEIYSNVDFKIIFDKTDEYKITKVNTGWTPRMGNNKFVGYQCRIQNFEVNGKKVGGNISLKNPKFNYPWDK